VPVQQQPEVPPGVAVEVLGHPPLQLPGRLVEEGQLPAPLPPATQPALARANLSDQLADGRPVAAGMRPLRRAGHRLRRRQHLSAALLVDLLQPGFLQHLLDELGEALHRHRVEQQAGHLGVGQGGRARLQHPGQELLRQRGAGPQPAAVLPPQFPVVGVAGGGVDQNPGQPVPGLPVGRGASPGRPFPRS
jgi:hypothetical protein